MARSIDWYYYRKGCKTCGKTDTYIDSNDLAVKDRLEAKARLGRDDALDLAAKASRIVIAKGKKILSYDMTNGAPDSETLLSGMLGPTGNLRAPVLRKGKTLLVGFNDEMYDEYLG